MDPNAILVEVNIQKNRFVCQAKTPPGSHSVLSRGVGDFSLPARSVSAEAGLPFDTLPIPTHSAVRIASVLL